MTHGQLFAGIGGFGLAAQWAGIENVWANEIDSFCCKVLRKNFKGLKIYEQDIREIGKHNLGSVDIITGGFPCQPFSHAGKRKGKEDDRYLWPEMLRVIKEVKPSWVVGENVDGLISMENGKTLERILIDLEDSGYHTETFLIPACGTKAWHRRNRIWIIANTNSIRFNENGIQQRTNNEVNVKRFYNDNDLFVPFEPSTNDIRGNNGLSTKLDEDRVKSLGNAIVPQVAYEIFKAIKHESEST